MSALSSHLHSERLIHLCPTNRPGNLLNADFLAGLLIVVIPLTLGEIDSRECSGGLNTLGFPVTLDECENFDQLRLERFTYVGLEINELQTTAVHLENLLASLLFLELVGLGTGNDGSRVGFLDHNVSFPHTVTSKVEDESKLSK